MANIIVLLVIMVIIALAILKVVSDKRKGSTCVGCSEGAKCSSAKLVKKTTFTDQQIKIKQLL